ncbi:CRISPR-associated endonuclease Cas3'', partial [Candidatus Pacearchaeota archaeon]|nr:CRISPR-associated endonuclease Cas3'' [Candidatus Pacearchaeota archaeon]
MSFSFKLKSHPDKKLVEHLENVGKLSKKIVASKQIENKNIFSEIAYLVGISHDFGKGTKAFQDKLETREDSKYAYHGFLSSLFGYFLIRKYLKDKNKIEEFWYVLPITWIIINKHHGNIRNIRGTYGELSKLKGEDEIELINKQIKDMISNNLNEIKEIYNRLWEIFDIHEFLSEFNNAEGFIKDIYKNVRQLWKQKDIQYYFHTLFFYSVLLDSDKLDASGDAEIPERIEKLEKEIVDRYKMEIFEKPMEGSIDELREVAYQEIKSSLLNLDAKKDRILSINLPTGSGKTLAGFSFALNLRDKIKKEIGFTPKLIYSLPFLSIIDQNSEVISNVLKIEKKEIPSNLMLIHHHLADVKYKEEKDNEMNLIEDINRALLLTESWHSEIVITTFVQFFHSLITNKNRAARKLHNMTNS